MVVVRRRTHGGAVFLFHLSLISLLFASPFTAALGIYEALKGRFAQYYISANVALLSRDRPLDYLLGPSNGDNDSPFDFPSRNHISIFSALLDSIDIMQSHYFEIWQGTWPEAIDWTAAVMGTQVSATLSTMSRFEESQLNLIATGNRSRAAQEISLENLINRYFTQITSFYFGENAFGLRMQAFDDMLWVVLGWLEGIKFIDQHSRLHQAYTKQHDDGDDLQTTKWYGQQFKPQFAHRARIFYDLASEGWNTSLCGGGMVWSPYLTPYKNAITNQLFIAASVGMYLYFPGDENTSPFHNKHDPQRPGVIPSDRAPDPRYLDTAVEAYKWLRSSNMTNNKGLYVDGFHISGWRGGHNGSIGSGQCDLRDEMVYTYNQGVLLSGLRGLWEATHLRHYLEDGHELIQNVMAATGWHYRSAQSKGEWAGIGRNGILEEACDSSGTCSQDGQTFKGIFFHHMASFCVPLRDEYFDTTERFQLETASLHRKRCNGYTAWVRYNANAAYATRDRNGEFGTWWGRPPRYHRDRVKVEESDIPNGATDYMNSGIPHNHIWRLPDDDPSYDATALGGIKNHPRDIAAMSRGSDFNDRGRGRSVETQSGGVAVLRALWQMEGMMNGLR